MNKQNKGSQPIEERAAGIDPQARDFLPAALALQEAPPSPIGRAIGVVVILAFVTAISWSFIGRVETVAVAHGKIIGAERSKVVQPLEAGIVRTILVTEGQAVEEGQALIELDTTLSDADAEQARQALVDAELLRQREQRFLAMLDDEAPSLLEPGTPDGQDISVARLMAERQLLAAQWQRYETGRQTLEAELVQQQAQLSASRSEIKRLAEVLPLERQREAAALELEQEGFVSSMGAMDSRQRRIDTARQLDGARTRTEAARQGVSVAQARIREHNAAARQTSEQAMSEAAQRVMQLAQELRKADQRASRSVLRAPASGVVQQLAVFTEGGVVTPAQALMVIVPENAKPEIEAILDNKDIGFVFAGQPATIKVETFPFTKYGTIDGEVKFVAQDAMADEQRGLVFSARLAMATHDLQVGARQVPLSPGMAVTVEVKTGD